MFFLASRGYRCIAHDRRGYGRSGQPWQGDDLETYADDLAAIMDFFGLQSTALVGHSTGGGVVAHYIGRHRTRRVVKAFLIGSVTPYVVKTPSNPTGTPIEMLDGFRQTAIANRAQFPKDLAVAYFGADRPGANVSQALLDACWMQDMLGGFPAAYFSIKAFSKTGMTEDLKRIDVPTLILHGDVDQIVPIGNACRSAELITNATIKIYPSALHVLIATSKDKSTMICLNS